MTFEANRTLLSALERPVPVVLRDYEQMIPAIRAFVAAAQDAVGAYSQIELQVAPHDHSDTCEACTILENVNLRYRNDLRLFKLEAGVCGSLQQRVSKSDAINRATTSDLLAVCLVTRSTIDSLVTSSALFMKQDIRIYNKYLAASLASLQTLKWSTMPQSVSDVATPVLNVYNGLSASKRNDSELFADPFPTFTAKVQYLRRTNTVDGFNDTLDTAETLFGALSNFIHGGTAFLAVANPDIPQIVTGRRPLRYTPFTYQVAELAGISMSFVLNLFATLYVPALIQSLAWVAGTQSLTTQLRELHGATAAQVAGMVF